MQLSDLMIAVRQRADMLPSSYTPALIGSSTFVTEPELISMINQSAFELYDLLVESMGEDYFVAPPAYFTTDGLSELYALPDGTTQFQNAAGSNYTATALYKLMGVDLLINSASSQWIALKPFQFSERNRYGRMNGSRSRYPTYHLTGGNLLKAER